MARNILLTIRGWLKFKAMICSKKMLRDILSKYLFKFNNKNFIYSEKMLRDILSKYLFKFNNKNIGISNLDR